MGYLRTKYGTDEQLAAASSKFVKFVEPGQVYIGAVKDFQEGRYGTEVHFEDGKVVTLSNAVLLREVVKADPGLGDKLEITYLGDEPLPPGESRNPTKLYKVRVARAAPVAFETAAEPASSADPSSTDSAGFEDEPF